MFFHVHKKNNLAVPGQHVLNAFGVIWKVMNIAQGIFDEVSTLYLLYAAI